MCTKMSSLFIPECTSHKHPTKNKIMQEILFCAAFSFFSVPMCAEILLSKASNMTCDQVTISPSLSRDSCNDNR